jgi:hypothetical protein
MEGRALFGSRNLMVELEQFDCHSLRELMVRLVELGQSGFRNLMVELEQFGSRIQLVQVEELVELEWAQSGCHSLMEELEQFDFHILMG